MLNTKFFTLIAGNPTKWDEETQKLVDDNNMKGLVSLQESQAARGRLSAHLIRSMYGWTVRYASGLQNFGLLHSSKSSDIRKAVEFGVEWANQDPQNREFYVSNIEIEKAPKDDDLTAYFEIVGVKQC